ncbi:LSU ribosomal protein L21p [hydrothermal vent metagenome]|uniref:LSU ribosomal protein L21p n=1 Tax=hydrothermal vent metagenome TaxID=652676 RepID=A0A3B1D3P4_9ZZZZ
MYAVVKTGGKQYKVAKGDLVTVEKIEGEVGATVELGEVLMAGEGEKLEIGAPTLEGRAVTAKIVEQGRGPKILLIKHLRRKNSRVKKGHRQSLTTLEIVSIT